MNMVTIYPNVYKVTEPHHITIDQFVQLIKTGGKSKDIILELRNTQDKSTRDLLKKTLPQLCLAGRFNHRKKEGCIEHSGLIPLDFDGLDKESVISMSPFVYMAWVSPSGTGTRALVRVPPSIENHERYFAALKDHFNTNFWDDNVGTVIGGSYLSYDPDIYINQDAPVWTELAPAPPALPPPPAAPAHIMSNDMASKAFDYVTKWLNDQGDYFAPGNRNPYIFKFASACARAGVDKQDTLNHCLQFQQKDFDKREIRTSVNSAYKSSQFGTWDINRQEPTRSPGRIHTPAAIPDEQPAPIVFWGYSNGKPFINRVELLKWFESIGIYQLRINKEGGAILIRIQNHVVNKADKILLSALVRDHLRTHADEVIYETFLRSADALLGDSVLRFLPVSTHQWNTDSKTRSWIYFRNTAVVVSASEPVMVPYSELPACIWESQIIDRDFSYMADTAQFEDCVFARFTAAVCGGDTTKVYALMSVAGYLLHTFKDPTKPGAIVFTDEVISDNPQGGTGKGIFIKSILKFRKHHYIDGKSFTFDRSFLWMGIDLDTKIVFMDDVRKTFDFERLFSVITEGVTVENKGKNTFYIPFESSPKFIITANSALKGEGNSHDRRKLEIEFSNFFNRENNPESFFKHQLYDEWDPLEWSRFDNYMVSCLQYYFQTGLSTPKSKNIEFKKLLANTSPEFLEWAELKIFPGLTSSKKDLYHDFLSDYPEVKKYVSSTRFYQFLESYIRYHKLNVEHKRINNVHTIFIPL